METPRHSFNVIRSTDRAMDPLGRGNVGRSSGVDFRKSAAGHPIVHYDGKHGRGFLVLDVYKLIGAPMYVHLVCPACSNRGHEQEASLRIGEENKKMSYEPDGVPKFAGFNLDEVVRGMGQPSHGGLISIEPFRCTWEIEPTLRRDFGFSVCEWSVAIDNNIARDV